MPKVEFKICYDTPADEFLELLEEHLPKLGLEVDLEGDTCITVTVKHKKVPESQECG